MPHSINKYLITFKENVQLIDPNNIEIYCVKDEDEKMAIRQILLDFENINYLIIISIFLRN